MGGKPNRGTKKDRRLKENKPPKSRRSFLPRMPKRVRK